MGLSIFIGIFGLIGIITTGVVILKNRHSLNKHPA
jgi:hypothetical protein